MCSSTDDPSEIERPFGFGRENAGAPSGRPPLPWACPHCGLVNWPDFKTGLPVVRCRKCHLDPVEYVEGLPGYGGGVNGP